MQYNSDYEWNQTKIEPYPLVHSTDNSLPLNPKASLLNSQFRITSNGTCWGFIHAESIYDIDWELEAALSHMPNNILEVYVRHPNDSGIQPIGPVVVTNRKFRTVNQPYYINVIMMLIITDWIIGHVNEYPTMHNFGILRHTSWMITYKILSEYFWKL